MGQTVPLRITVNGEEHESEVQPRLLLVHYLRHELGLTGTNVGCDTSNCGACTVLIDGHDLVGIVSQADIARNLDDDTIGHLVQAISQEGNNN